MLATPQGPPIVTPSAYMQRHWGQFVVPETSSGGKQCPHIPGPLPPRNDNGTRMLQVFVSAAVPSCFLWTMFIANHLQYTVTQVCMDVDMEPQKPLCH